MAKVPMHSQLSRRHHICIETLSHRRSTIDQVTLLTQYIEDSFSVKKKAGAVLFVAVYNRGLQIVG